MYSVNSNELMPFELSCFIPAKELQISLRKFAAEIQSERRGEQQVCSTLPRIVISKVQHEVRPYLQND